MNISIQSIYPNKQSFSLKNVGFSERKEAGILHWPLGTIYLCVLLLTACQPQTGGRETGSNEKATLTITHAKIITLDEQNTVAQAVAIKEGKIIAVGTNAEIE